MLRFHSSQAFEEVFETMMKRIGESDISRIVDMFQKQTLTHQAWTEAVRDQEIRVKALQVERPLLIHFSYACHRDERGLDVYTSFARGKCLPPFSRQGF